MKQRLLHGNSTPEKLNVGLCNSPILGKNQRAVGLTIQGRIRIQYRRGWMVRSGSASFRTDPRGRRGRTIQPYQLISSTQSIYYTVFNIAFVVK